MYKYTLQHKKRLRQYKCPASRWLQKKIIIKTKAEKQTTNYNTNLQTYWQIKNTHTHTKPKGWEKQQRMCTCKKK